MSIVTVGINLAKNVFAVHGVDENGQAVLVKPKVPRDKWLELYRARSRLNLLEGLEVQGQ